MKIIIDADPLVYRVGFASEDHSYEVVYEDESGEMFQEHFHAIPDKTAGVQMKEYKDEHPDRKILEKEMIVKPHPLPHALHIAKSSITAMISDISRQFKSEDNEVVVLLGSSDNFRDALATIRPYKDNRDSLTRPYHYQSVRDYLIDNHAARIITGREADDEASILAWQCPGPHVVASTDKDLDQIPGWHYNYEKKVFYEVDKDDGVLYFFQQALSGDATDTIPGCYRIGDVKAKKMVTAWYRECHDPDWQSYVWKRIVGEFQRTKDDCPDKVLYKTISAEEAALETARLVFMQQYALQLWCPPGVPDEMLEGGLDD